MSMVKHNMNSENAIDVFTLDIEMADDVPNKASQRIELNKGRKQGVDQDKGLSVRSSSYTSMTNISSMDSSNAGIDQQRLKDIGEAILFFNYAEKAALKIQNTFRQKQRSGDNRLPNEEECTGCATDADDPEDIENGGDDHSSEEAAATKYTFVFLAAMAVVMVLLHLVLGFWNLIRRCFGHDTGDAEVLTNTTVPQGGGGGSPGGGETGGVQSAAMQGMAAQAAGSAASGAASGATAGAAAGVAAGAAAAGATAAVGITQVAAVVAMSTAAIAATTAGVSVAVSSSQTSPVFLSTCGLSEPDYRSGRFSIFFEGIPRPFDSRESVLVEDLVLQSYNEITMGDNVTLHGCLDPLSREMLSVKLSNQTFVPIGKGVEQPILGIVLDTTLSCDRCSKSRPMFSREQVGRSGNEAETEDMAVSEQGMGRRLQDFDFESQAFFQKLLQLIIIEADELSEIGELPRGFVQVSEAYVITDESEIVLLTNVRYEKTAERTIIQFVYTDEATDEETKKTVEILSNGVGVPTTPFPTFQPSNAPTELPLPSESPSTPPTVDPSERPSASPTESLQPSIVPSVSPSAIPSSSPTELPSSRPSSPPSWNPSSVPSQSPSSAPSSSPSGLPTVVPSSSPSVPPSESPSTRPSIEPFAAPSMVPSISPSAAPSSPPSESPSSGPSSAPSNGPTSVPSATPSSVPSDSKSPSLAPSISPSRLPSASPSESPSLDPSPSPSGLPSSAPSMNPTPIPSASPTGVPSSSPSAGPTGIPSAFPSGLPSSHPSVAPTGIPSASPSELPSLHPSVAPTGIPSASPSELPSWHPSIAPTGIPSASPSTPPSLDPSSLPSGLPSSAPSTKPTYIPSASPTGIPSSIPSAGPTGIPSVSPSGLPSSNPSVAPTGLPSFFPSMVPSGTPSAMPTGAMQLLESNFPVSMSSLSPLHPFATAEKGIDGNKDGNFASKSCFHTDPSDTNPWWQVELDDSSPNGWGKPVVVKSVKIWNRTDCCTTRLDGARVELINSGGVVMVSEILSVPNGDLAPKTVDFGEVNGVARIRVILDDSTVPLHFAEMEAYGYVR